jgi:hypothetical protein
MAENFNGDSVECLARELIDKLRNSNFLEENPPHGESLFTIQAEPAISFQAESEDCVNAPQESIEELARSVILQLRSAGMPIQTDINESSSFSGSGDKENKETKLLTSDFEELFGEDCAFELCTVDGVVGQARYPVGFEISPVQSDNSLPDQVQTTQSLKAPAYTKPGLGDAISFLLGELDRPCAAATQNPNNRALSSSVAQPSTDNEDKDFEDDGLVEAFRALAPTVDAFLLDISGQLEELPHACADACADPSTPAAAPSPG